MMGQYVNPGSEKYQMRMNSKIFIDKTELIIKTNEVINTGERYICISRPRRFGKTMAAEMLAAYYGNKEDTNTLFAELNIAKHSTYTKHLNKYNALMINMQVFLSETTSIEEMLLKLQLDVGNELIEANPEVRYKEKTNLRQIMTDLYLHTKCPFVILIDEWDCLFREYKDDLESQKKYLDFLRVLLKDQVYVGLAYMTGILPIKKYGSHSALNMFDEHSMIDSYNFINYFGFTHAETKALCIEFNMEMEEIKAWYNGYFIELNNPIYNPTSVTKSLLRKRLGSYWNKTETYEALKDYIKLDIDELQNKITRLIAGEHLKVNVYKFSNDMRTFNSSDDVLALLIHLGYLSYCEQNNLVRIPNEEVKREFINSIEDLSGWENIVDAIRNSDALLKAIWNEEEDVVADGIQLIHEKSSSILQYNDENSLSCALNLALYTASNYYTIIREFPSGKGFADLIFLPRKKHADKPAMIIELKWNKAAHGAISQIKNKHYPSILEEYHGNLLLVGLNYDKSNKIYDCLIEIYQI